jgi:hypothetical protein
MKKIPEMTRTEEHEFWKTHSAADYLEEMEPVTVVTGSRPQNRCGECKETLLSRFIDVELKGGRGQLRGLRQLYCPNGHEARLAPEAQRLVTAIESVLSLSPVYDRQRSVA